MKILDPHVPLGDVIDSHGVPTDTLFPNPTKDNHELDCIRSEILVMLENFLRESNGEATTVTEILEAGPISTTFRVPNPDRAHAGIRTRRALLKRREREFLLAACGARWSDGDSVFISLPTMWNDDATTVVEVEPPPLPRPRAQEIDALPFETTTLENETSTFLVGPLACG